VKTVIYLDELLLVNFVLGAALLLCAGLLSARECSGVRLLAGSGCAGLAGAVAARAAGACGISL